MKRKILMVAYSFPPRSVTGTFRSLGFARNLVSIGWDVTVLSASEYLDGNRDNSLLAKVPPEVRVWNAPVYDPFIFWKKFKSKNRRLSSESEQHNSAIHKKPGNNKKNSNSFTNLISSLLQTPDLSIGWLFPALREARKIPKPDVIYSSAPPFTSHLIGCLLKLRWRVPLVTDFRDPWTDNPFKVYTSKTVQRWDRFLEKSVFKRSDLIIANTSRMADIFEQKNPQHAEKIRVVTNGFDAEDFCDILPRRAVTENDLLLIHPGSLYGKRNPLNFLSALKNALDGGCARLRVLFIGTCEDFEGKSLAEHVKNLGLEQYVEIRPPVGRKEVLSLMKGADGLLLFSQGTSLQVPAKLFEYLALGKNIIAIGEKNNAANDILQQVPGNYFLAENTVSDITNILKSFYSTAAGHKDFTVEIEDSPLERGRLTQKLSEYIEEIFLK